MSELLVSFIIMCLTVCGATSGFLYSNLLKEVREWWLRVFKNSRLKDYAECQLCLSVPVTLSIQWIFLSYAGIMYYICFALATACVSWGLGTFITMCGWIRCYQKESYFYLLDKVNKDDK